MGHEKKEYSAEELLQFAYKHNQIPEILFAKDTECRYVYTSEIENVIDGGEENSIIGKTDMQIQQDPELGKTFFEQDREIMRTGKTLYCYCEFNDNGKKVYGHSAGDTYIKATAEMIKNVLPENGICVRWGGDEFLLILPDCDEDACKKLVEEMEEQQKIKRKEIPYMEIAIGCQVRKSLHQDEDEVIKAADQNMYEDKKRKKAMEWK